jgi:hypothetical protein
MAYYVEGFYLSYPSSYVHENFMQEIDPLPNAGRLPFDCKFAGLLGFSRKAERRADAPNVFIVDEIFRRNLSRVFDDRFPPTIYLT